MFKSWIYPQITFCARIHLSQYAHGYDAALLNTITISCGLVTGCGLKEDQGGRVPDNPARASGPG